MSDEHFSTTLQGLEFISLHIATPFCRVVTESFSALSPLKLERIGIDPSIWPSILAQKRSTRTEYSFIGLLNDGNFARAVSFST